MKEAYRIPRKVIEKWGQFPHHVNAHIVVLPKAILEAEGVEDVTELIASELAKLGE